MNAIVPRKTVEQVVAARDETLRLYAVAFERISEAATSLKDAEQMWDEASPEKSGRYYDGGTEARDFLKAVRLPDRQEYLETAKRLVDITVWQNVIRISGIEDVMDAVGKKELREQMRYRKPSHTVAGKFIDGLQQLSQWIDEDLNTGEMFRWLNRLSSDLRDASIDEEILESLDDEGRENIKSIVGNIIENVSSECGFEKVENWLDGIRSSLDNLLTAEVEQRGLPDVTVDNIMATLSGLLGQSNELFLRGVANSFSSLDRRFKSHDGFKIGSRVILDGLCDPEWGNIRYGFKEDVFLDIERILKILDGGEPGALYGSIIETIKQERGNTLKAHQSEHLGVFFRVRVFKNGNAHLWFTRDDLVRKVNRCLGEYYGEVIGDGQQTEADPLKDQKTSLAKNYGFFPTPDSTASNVIEKAQLHGPAGLRILEPSAGTGQLSSRAARLRHSVDCVEVQPHLVELLKRDERYNEVLERDFLQMAASPHYDRVIMNPPFDRERDIDHVVHALKFLKPDGFLIAIMSAGTMFRETKKSIAFRKLIADMGGRFTDLPERSFAEAGTNINTCYVRVWNDGTKIDRWS